MLLFGHESATVKSALAAEPNPQLGSQTALFSPSFCRP
jgi:hypothetical protein